MEGKNYEVVIGQSSDGMIELPFTYDMLNRGVCWLAGKDVDENKLDEVQKDLRRRLYALSDEVVNEYLGEWFYEKEDETWLAEASREEKLRWVIQLIEKTLDEEIFDDEDWEKHCQPFEAAT